MKNTFFKQRSFYAVFLSVVLSVVLVAGAAGAVTTISTNITTGGTLTVSSLTSLNGNVNIGDAAVTDNDLVYLYGTTTVIGAQAFVFGSSTGATIEGQAAGSVYFDSTSNVLRLFDGTNWVAQNATTSGFITAGTGGREIRLSDLTTDYVLLGTTTQSNYNGIESFGGSVLTITATTTTSVPLQLFGLPDQTGDLIGIFANNETEYFSIDAYGNASTTNSLSLGSATTNQSFFFVGGMATTTGSTGAFASQGGLTINGNTTLGDTAADTLTLTANATTSNSFQVGISSKTAELGDLYVSGMATTTGATGAIATEGTLIVGGDVSGTAIDRIFAGICTFDETGLTLTIAASSTRFVHCGGATGVTAGDRVMVTATSSLDGNIIIQAASSTASAISVQLFNLGMSTGTANIWGETSAVDVPLSLQFWAFR